MDKVRIVPSVLKAQVEVEGKKLKDLATMYGLPESQMKKALQQQGLKIRRLHYDKFVFAEESPAIQAAEVDETPVDRQAQVVEEAVVPTATREVAEEIADAVPAGSGVASDASEAQGW